VANVLEEDADFRPVVPGSTGEPLVDLSPLGIEVLAGPRWAAADNGFSTSQRAFFDEVRVSTQDTQFGAFGPFDELVQRWELESSTVSDALAQRATARAADLASAHPDSYNGVFPRLLAWRVEASSTGPVRRLHLSVERTTFLTWLVTNGDPGLPDELKDLLSVAGPEPAIGANHVPVTVAVTSADGYVVLPQRASDLAIYPDCFVSAANGNVEVQARHGMPADLDDDGFVDFLGAALRECQEELGARIDIERGDLRVAALIRYSDLKEHMAPVLVLHATSGLTLDQIVDGMKHAHPIEGAFEIGNQVLGVPVAVENCDAVIPWLVEHCQDGRLTVPGFTSTLIAIAAAAGPTAVARGLANHRPGSARPSCVRVVRR
jgi:8-oxo-dGTP pyrophosphatase MutT (NUDIX family)